MVTMVVAIVVAMAVMGLDGGAAHWTSTVADCRDPRASTKLMASVSAPETLAVLLYENATVPLMSVAQLGLGEHVPAVPRLMPVMVNDKVVLTSGGATPLTVGAFGLVMTTLTL